MNEFSRPIVPLCLSSEDDSLLAYVARLGAWLNWKHVEFVHVVGGRDASVSFNVETWQGRMREHVRHHFDRDVPGLKLAFHAAQGSRLDEILQIAIRRDRDLVLLGHRRARSGRRALARRLAMLAPASVWLVPEATPARVTSILVPVDFSAHSADALKVAIGIARGVGLSRVQVIHVFFDSSTIRYDEHVEEIVGQEEAAFDAFIAKIDMLGIEVDPVFVEGTRPAQDILRMAGRFGSDLIVTNTRGRSHAASVLLGSTTSAIMAAANVPVLAVKHFGAQMTFFEALVSRRFKEEDTLKAN